MKTQHKRWTPSAIEWKADEPGSFRAIFSTLNEIDKDGDVTVPGAFKQGQEVRIAQWGHNWDALPIGKGVINSDQKEAWVDGEFFLDTPHGDAAYKTIRGLGSLQEWSYGFTITEKAFGDFNGRPVRFLRGLDVAEVSPVMIGAGNHTRTESIKGLKFDPGSDSYEQLRRELHTAVQALVTTPMGGSTGYTYVEETYPDYCIVTLYRFANESTMASEETWRVPYTVDAAGDIQLGVPQQVEQVWQVIGAKTFEDEAQTALAAVESLVVRGGSLAELRRKEGRAISTARRDQMAGIVTGLREAADGLDAILTETAPAPKAAEPVTRSSQAEIFRFRALLAGITEGVSA